MVEESYYYQNEMLLLTVSDSQLKDFYYLGNAGNPLAVASKTSDGMKSYTYQKDVQESTRAVTDTDGKCVEWYEYSDFGETTIHEEQAGFENVLCYTGGVYDESSGLYYLNARYYNPEMGRFISRDTYEGKNEEPSSLHLYLYCANDPVNYVDPSGHERKIAVMYYTGYNNGREKEHNGLRIEACNSPYYDANWSNVKFYKITQAKNFNKIWNEIKGSKANEVYLYLHGGIEDGRGQLYFRNSQKDYSEILKSCKKNQYIEKLYLVSCKGAAGGKQSIAYALWLKIKGNVYAAKTKISFHWVYDTRKAYRSPCYPKSHVGDPIKLQKF